MVWGERFWRAIFCLGRGQIFLLTTCWAGTDLPSTAVYRLDWHWPSNHSWLLVGLALTFQVQLYTGWTCTDLPSTADNMMGLHWPTKYGLLQVWPALTFQVQPTTGLAVTDLPITADYWLGWHWPYKYSWKQWDKYFFTTLSIIEL